MVYISILKLGKSTSGRGKVYFRKKWVMRIKLFINIQLWQEAKIKNDYNCHREMSLPDFYCSFFLFFLKFLAFLLQRKAAHATLKLFACESKAQLSCIHQIGLKCSICRRLLSISKIHLESSGDSCWRMSTEPLAAHTCLPFMLNSHSSRGTLAQHA